MCSPGPRQPPSTTPAPAHCEEEAAGNNRGRVGRHRSPGSGSLRKLPTPSSVTALRLSPARLFRRFQTVGRLHDGERAGTWPSSKNLTALASPYVRKRHRRAKPLFLLRRSEVQAVVPEGFGRPLGVGVAPFETRPRRSASTATLRPPSPTDRTHLTYTVPSISQQTCTCEMGPARRTPGARLRVMAQPRPQLGHRTHGRAGCRSSSSAVSPNASGLSYRSRSGP